MKQSPLALLAAVLVVASPPAHTQSRPSLADVLHRAGQGVERYAEAAANMLVDERGTEWVYEKQKGEGYPLLSKRRTWNGEMALIRTPEMSEQGYPWLEFRDVFRVNGRTLPDRRGRLERLFRGRGEWTTAKAAAIAQESARYNIGPIWRNLNTPAVGLLMLQPGNQSRFAFSEAGEELIGRTRVWKVEYREQHSPALIRTGEEGDCAASGAVWIDPANGDVLRSQVRCGNPPAWSTEMTVTYERKARFEACVPVRVVERAAASGGRVWSEGDMRYSNYRRFETKARVMMPK